MINITGYEVAPDASGNILWLGRMGNPAGPSVLMIHGAIENSRIFYSEKGKGLAPFLAEKGFDVFVADLRGKGKSNPRAHTKKIKAGQHEAIMEDLPALVKKIQELKGEHSPLHLMSHSWGGILLACFYARFYKDPALASIRSMVFFASKRKIYVQNLRRWLMVELGWTVLGTLATWLCGYLPAKKLKMGSDDEPAHFFLQCNRWVYSRNWKEKKDGFDYKEALKKSGFPPLLAFTGLADHTLGNKKCVQKMLDEIQPPQYTFKILSVKNGSLHNYDHINILTHPDAAKDHFIEVVDWLKKYN